MEAPRKAPYVSMASIAYCEQVGSKRQTGGRRLEKSRYVRIPPKMPRFSKFTSILDFS